MNIRFKHDFIGYPPPDCKETTFKGGKENDQLPEKYAQMLVDVGRAEEVKPDAKPAAKPAK